MAGREVSDFDLRQTHDDREQEDGGQGEVVEGLSGAWLEGGRRRSLGRGVPLQRGGQRSLECPSVGGGQPVRGKCEGGVAEEREPVRAGFERATVSKLQSSRRCRAAVAAEQR